MGSLEKLLTDGQTHIVTPWAPEPKIILCRPLVFPAKAEIGSSLLDIVFSFFICYQYQSNIPTGGKLYLFCLTPYLDIKCWVDLVFTPFFGPIFVAGWLTGRHQVGSSSNRPGPPFIIPGPSLNWQIFAVLSLPPPPVLQIPIHDSGPNRSM